MTEHDVEVVELDFLNKRLAMKNAQNECGHAQNECVLAYEMMCEARRQFLLEKTVTPKEPAK